MRVVQFDLTKFFKCATIFPFSMAAFLTVVSLAGMVNAGEPGLLRFPDIHENTVVFVCGEDIWSASIDGGIATRLTINDGEERFPRFSPDGSLIAFSGQYDGNADIYVMDRHGGNITRVTYHPAYDEVVGWHPTKNKILFSSRRDSYNRFTRLFLISPDGSGLERLELPEAAQGSFSPDGKQIAYNKVARENRTWKRYAGGMAQDVYLYDFASKKEQNLSNFIGTDRLPMWIDKKIYFSSDRDRVLNIFAYDTDTGLIEKLTDHSEYDVRRPSMGGEKIVYELGGDLWMLDVNDKSKRRIAIDVRSDAPEARPYLSNAVAHLTEFHVSPSGKRALLVARGEVFTVPRKYGPTRNLTMDSGSRDRGAAWSPDGRQIAYISDRSGEYEIYVVSANGNQTAVQLTQHQNGYRHNLRWSPDSKKIAFADQTLRCYYLDVATRKITEIDRAEFENVDVALDRKPISDYSWSPDSRYLAYAKMNADLLYQVYIYDLSNGQRHLASNGLFNDFEPEFTTDGKHLLFVSNRRFDPVFCDFEWEMVYKKTTGIYALTLASNGEALLPFRNDEEAGEPAKKDSQKSQKAANSKLVMIDFAGLPERIEALPLQAGNYRDISVNANGLFYLNADEGDFNRFEYRAVGPRTLYHFRFEDREESAVVDKIAGYKLSADGSTIVFRQSAKIGMIASADPGKKQQMLDLSEVTMRLDPPAEWKQMFNEAWRMQRDFYYEANMHGLDWAAMKQKYGRLIERATCRQDVGFIIGELIGELNTSHTYVYGGDERREMVPVNTGMLGVDWQIDQKNSLYRFKKILRTTDWTQEIMPPLARPGIAVNEGDYLLEVNGEAVTANRNIYSYFTGLADQQVDLLVNSRPGKSGAKLITVKPLASETTLRYLDWVEHNRLVAARESDGQIGYIHLPDTYTGSAREFPKYFYSQTRKKGLIIDGRFNGGGLDPDIFLQRLDKELHSYWTRRYSHHQTTPAVVTRAHMVCLTNRQAGSGGDMLPMEFQMRDMGPVIGTRTWGGLVGVSMFIEMIDGGGLTAPDYRIYDKDGKWIVENHGVEPNIVVDLDAAEMARGIDGQLMKAIEVLKEKIREDPLSWPKHNPFPVDVPAETLLQD